MKDFNEADYKFAVDKVSSNGFKVIITGSTALCYLKHGLQEPKDLDLLVIEEDLPGVEKTLECLGYVKTASFPQHAGFDLRSQLKKGGLKIDLFIVDKSFSDYTKIGRYRFANPAIVWAARGYYLGRYSRKKDMDRFKKLGFIPNAACAENCSSGDYYHKYGGTVITKAEKKSWWVKLWSFFSKR
jgi:hypothetical protein